MSTSVVRAYGVDLIESYPPQRPLTASARADHLKSDSNLIVSPFGPRQTDRTDHMWVDAETKVGYIGPTLAQTRKKLTASIQQDSMHALCKECKCQWIYCPQPCLHSWIPNIACIVVWLTTAVHEVYCLWLKIRGKIGCKCSVLWISICRKVMNRSADFPRSKHRPITVNWSTWLIICIMLPWAQTQF